MANEEHVARLRQGVETWNAWRSANRNVRPDHIDADLSGATLTGADLSGADLRDAYLMGADLSGAELSEARLGGTMERDTLLSFDVGFLNFARFDQLTNQELWFITRAKSASSTMPRRCFGRTRGCATGVCVSGRDRRASVDTSCASWSGSTRGGGIAT